MDNVKTFPFKKKLDETTRSLYELGCDIDQVLISYLEKGIDCRQMAIILAHRLGELVRTMEDKNEVAKTAIETFLQKSKAEYNG